MDILKVSGSHFECGRQIGQAFQSAIKSEIDAAHGSAAPGLTWEGTLAAALKYKDYVENYYPQLLEEVKGVAAGAAVPEDELFCYMIEELWAAPTETAKGCSDIIVTPPLTDGQIIVGHNNDLSPTAIDKCFPVIWQFDDGTSIFTTGPLGFYVSIGVNSFGIALTGNEVTPTDNKIGVPRSIIARAILTAKTYDEALKIATDPHRASSYNNIISTKDKVVSVEGSGTSYELLYPANGLLAHTNHYVCSSMLKFEGRPKYTSSIERLARSLFLGSQKKHFAVPDIAAILSDHDNTDGSANTLCRHDTKSETVFSVIIDFGDGSVRLAKGHPCTAQFDIVWTIPH